jgi:hypothetical protein
MVSASLMVGEVGKVGEVGDATASCGGGWAEYLRLRQSTMKQVTAGNAKRCEYVGTETRKKEDEETYSQGSRGQPSLCRQWL